jgi:hypothetical protein
MDNRMIVLLSLMGKLYNITSVRPSAARQHKQMQKMRVCGAYNVHKNTR